MGKIFRTLLPALTAVALAMLAACGKVTSEPSPLVPVRTAEVQTIEPNIGNTYSANIQPYQQVDLSFKSSGYLVSIRQVRDADGHVRNIDQGDYVTKGTVLATVQQDDYQQKLAQANAQLEKAKAEHERATLSFGRVSTLLQGRRCHQAGLRRYQCAGTEHAGGVGQRQRIHRRSPDCA